MTTFVAWVGVDSRGAASLNFAADSRISWGSTGKPHWDMGRKTFASIFSPDIFGYVNDVMFPSMIIGQIINVIDSGGLFKLNDSCETRFNKVVKHIKNSHNLYPSEYRNSFCIFHGSRQGTGLTSNFEVNTIAWDKETGRWTLNSISIPEFSSAIIVDGSGTNSVHKWSKRWNSSSQGRTSRAVFSSFCSAITSCEDKFTNGMPQLVSLYRKDFGKTIGFVNEGKKYISGMEVLSSTDTISENIEWRNKYFERYDGSGDTVIGAKKHYVPKGLL